MIEVITKFFDSMKDEENRVLETGLTQHQTVDAFMDGIERFGTCKFNYSSIRQFALKFDQSVFEQKIREFVTTVMN